MTINLEQSQHAIHSFLHPATVDKSGAKKLVIREKEEGGKRVKFIDYAPLHAGEKALRFFGAGSANFKNVVQFALENNVLEGLEESDKQDLLEKSYTYNRGHNWLRSFMRVDLTQLVQKMFGNKKELDQVISDVQKKVLIRERAKAVSLLGPGMGILQLMEEKNPLAAKILLQQSQPKNPEEKDTLSGKILLHQAIESGDTELVIGLLKGKKINTFARGLMGQTALHLAVNKGSKEMVEALIESNPQGVNDQDRFGNTALHNAIRGGKDEIVSVLLKSQQLNLALTNDDKQTVLHFAVFSKQKGLWSDLLAHESSAAAVDKKDKSGQSALGMAMTSNEEAALALLPVVSDETRKQASNVSYEFNPRVYCAYRAREKAPLQDEMLLITDNGPINKRQLDIMERLIQTHNVHQAERDAEGRAPLHRAVETGSMEVIELFLKNKDPLLNLRDKKGRTPLQIAIESGKDSIAIRLLSDPRVLLNVHDNSENTPLQTAILRGNWKVANAILDHEKFGLNHQNKDGDTALMLAITRSEPNLDFLKRLLAIKELNLTLQDAQGQNVIHRVMLGDSTGVLDQFFPHLLEATLKQDKNAVNVPDKTGRTPLHAAVNIGKENYVQSLIMLPNIDVNVKDTSSKYTPLHSAVLRGREDLVILLVQSGKMGADEIKSVQEFAKRFGRDNLLYHLSFKTRVE